MAEVRGAVRLVSRGGNRLCQMCLGRGQCGQEIQTYPQISVGLHEDSGVLLALGEDEVLFPQLPGRLEFRPLLMKRCQSSQYPEELRCISHLATEFPGPGPGLPNFRDSPPPGAL